jgi:hypothetical protein
MQGRPLQIQVLTRGSHVGAAWHTWKRGDELLCVRVLRMREELGGRREFHDLTVMQDRHAMAQVRD